MGTPWTLSKCAQTVGKYEILRFTVVIHIIRQSRRAVSLIQVHFTTTYCVVSSDICPIAPTSVILTVFLIKRFSICRILTTDSELFIMKIPAISIRVRQKAVGVSPSGRRWYIMQITFTFHVGSRTISIILRVKGNNRHSAKWRLFSKKTEQ